MMSFATRTGWNLQDKFLYFPSLLLPSPEELVAYEIDFWPSGQADYRGFVGEPPQGNPKGTVVVFHGNAGHAADRAYYREALTPLGYRVVLAEYPGYGARPGRVGEESFVRDAAETMRQVAARHREPIYVLGESLGAGVAAALAKATPTLIAGIILITPWDTLATLAKARFSFLPVGLLLRDRYDSIENLRGFSGKVALVAAERDEIIPLEHALNLHRRLEATKKLWIIPQAGHNDWMLRIDSKQWRDYMNFLETATERLVTAS